MHGSAVGSEDDVRVEEREKCVEFAAAGGSEEGVDNLSLASEIGAGSSSRSLDTSARPAGELPRGSWRAPHNRSNLPERHGKDVVQHERQRSEERRVGKEG